MTRALRVIAPAKINWSLEVLRVRPDGYHELRSVLQTIALHDVLTIEEADGLSLEVTGDDALSGEPAESNLAYRAAVALRARAGVRTGAKIRLEKRVPLAAGLGGGSSDGAAVLRALDLLWNTEQPRMNLVEIAGEIGSDPPFFIESGTAAVSGRGDAVEPLPDAVAPSIMLAIPAPGHRGNKTAAMFGGLSPDDYSDGDVTLGLREAVVSARMLNDGLLNNVFERVTSKQQLATARAMASLAAEGYVPHLCGAGPSFFLLYGGGADLADVIARRVRETGFEPVATHTLGREQALAIEEL